jgi:1-aminocyclopropane-1-carboxylate deaminase/D-cysteine desulfhydrase-like pyridoxal-dependent ACC family enzyme
VSRSAEEQEKKVGMLCTETLELLQCKRALPREAVRANGDYIGQGYGLPTGGMIAAVALTASSEGLLLDPVYTGKAMAGLVDLIGNGEFSADDNLVFLHTGGSPALFAYRSTFDGL